MRIVSLLPSTTEIVCALGMGKNLVGRSHECDYPASIQHLPAVTKPAVEHKKKSKQTHNNIKSRLEQGLSVFEVDSSLLAELRPDVILTQDHCEVCAASFSQVEHAVHHYVETNPEILSVSPTTLSEVWESFHQIAKQIHAQEKAKDLEAEINERTEIIENTVMGQPVKTVVCIEWLDPVMTAGNWIPEMIEIAGGDSLLAEAGKHSPWVTLKNITEADPDVLFLMPCGYSIKRTCDEIHHLEQSDFWNELKAVRNSEVYILDGNNYFNRPGPRLFESIRIFAEILHPSQFKPLFRNKGWMNINQMDEVIRRAAG